MIQAHGRRDRRQDLHDHERALESGTQVAFNVDIAAPTGSVTDPGANLAGTVVLDATVTDADSAVASVQFQRAVANGVTWTNIGAADTTAPYTASFDTTGVTDGLYDFRVVMTDVATNAANSAVLEDRRVDNTAPASTTTFPTTTTYSASGWNAGCGTSGFCGTASDGGSGVQGVQVSVRQGTGNYWSAGSFSSGTEVWNSATYATGNWSYAFAGSSFPADGSYTVRVRATDVAGNVQTPTSTTFTIDTTPPQTTINTNPSNPTASTSAAFTFSSSEGGSTFQCRIDGGAWGACTSPQNYASLTDASHTFEVRATDSVGNQDASAASYTWLVDTTAPTSTTSFPAASGGEYNLAGWNAGCGTSGLCGTYGDGTGSGVSQVQVSLRRGAGNYWNGTAFASGVEVWNTATLVAGNWSYAFPASSFPADDSYTVRVRAVDAVSNTQTPANRTFTYDATNPSALFTFPASAGNYTTAGWNAGCATSGFCGTHSDAGSGVQSVQVSVRRVSTGNYWNGTSFASGLRGLPDRDARRRQLVVRLRRLRTSRPTATTRSTCARPTTPATPRPAPRARSRSTTPRPLRPRPSRPRRASTRRRAGTRAAGRPASAAPPRTAAPASRASQVSIRQGAGNYWNGTGFSSGSEVWNATTYATGNWSYAFAAANFPADGSYTIRVRATDVAGNVETPSNRTFTIDRTAPQTTIDSSPANPTSATGATFNFSSSEGSSTFQCRIDGGSWNTCTSPESYASLSDGSHTFDVRATDQAGNQDASPASYTWLVDTTAPTSTATFPVASGSYTAAEWNAGCGHERPLRHLRRRQRLRCRRGRGLHPPGHGQLLGRLGLLERLRGLERRHARRRQLVVRVRRGQLPRRRLLHRARARARRGREHADRDEPDVHLRRDRPERRRRLPAGLRGLQRGGLGRGLRDERALRHLLRRHVRRRRRRGLHPAGHAATTGTAPASRAPPRSGTTPPSPAGDWEYGLDAADFPADGSYTVRVRATDVAGNTAAPSSLTFTYDTTAPQTTIDDGPADPTTSTDPSFEFSANEPGSTFECRRDGGAWGPCTSPKDYIGLADGSHTFDVRATDTAGNTDASAGDHDLGDRHGRTELDGRVPRRLRQLHGRRVERGLRHERPLRHVLRRLRLRRRRRRGLDPAGLRRLLGRRRLHERLRGLEQRDPRGRRLGVRLRRGQLPRRRLLHRARPRA